MTRTALPAIAALLSLAACAGPAGPAGRVPVPAPPAPAATPMRPGQVDRVTMPPTRTIDANVAGEPALSRLAAAFKATGLATTLAGTGPFTLFAPSDAAFARLPPAALQSLMEPRNATTLARVLRYHVVAGTVTTADLLARIRAGNGEAALSTLAGVPIRASMTGDVITLTSETGNRSYIEVTDVRQANGMVHVVNGVLIPALD